MIALSLPENALHELGERFGSRLQFAAPLSRYVAARMGGQADALLEIQSIEELVATVTLCWQADMPYWILGGGSNVLVSDAGLRGLVLINRARQARFEIIDDQPRVWAESGANLGLVARQAAAKGFSGLEWAAGIPGTIGGAVVGNAGAHGADIAACLQVAAILHRIGMSGSGNYVREDWLVERLEYAYRTSVLKKLPGQAIVLSALIKLEQATSAEVQSRIDELVEYRHRTQPPGASMGSMFKNPAGDYAGRLIELAGLKGYRIGNAQISPKHANFFINLGNCAASDVYALILLAREKVMQQFGVWLELEIELLGDW
ncbi:MAG: UDP-N-acetylenolpyruvoylglucosamine reductase [Anaerolineae bacterium UTCFX2]|jgi:UDP-N-acetylmuramate dehydrogenase|nr:MAG: UDP-N-acetylenolpyruvoylglucosamine reductase [Anaerolineae bacterium UTCFX2]